MDRECEMGISEALERNADIGFPACYFARNLRGAAARCGLKYCAFYRSIAIIFLITVSMLILLTGTHEKSTDLTFVRIGGWFWLG